MPLLRNLGAENNVTEVVSIFPYTDLQSFSKVGFHSLKYFGLHFIDRLPNRGLQFQKGTWLTLIHMGLRKPQRKKSHVDKSGERGGHGTSPNREMT